MEILISHGFLVGSALLALWGRALLLGYKKLKSLETKSEQYKRWLAACWSGLIALTAQSLIDLSFSKLCCRVASCFCCWALAADLEKHSRDTSPTARPLP